MSPELAFWLSLILKMAVTAGFVVSAAMVTERVGPTFGALFSTLPMAAGPSYFFLALDHDSAFIAQTAIGSIAAHAATGVFALVYVVLAQRHNMVVSVLGAIISWFVVALPMRTIEWTFLSVAAANLAIYAICIAFLARYPRVAMPRVERKWYDLPLRAAMVAVLVATVVLLSGHVGPMLTGLLAIYPIVLLCMMLIFHPRAGGPATASLIKDTMWGLVGFSVCLFTVHLATVPLGTPVGLVLALAVSIGWNLSAWSLRRRKMAAAVIQS